MWLSVAAAAGQLDTGGSCLACKVLAEIVARCWSRSERWSGLDPNVTYCM